MPLDGLIGYVGRVSSLGVDLLVGYYQRQEIFLPQQQMKCPVFSGQDLQLEHHSIPRWSDEESQELLLQLQYADYSWLRPEGVRRKLIELADARVHSSDMMREHSSHHNQDKEWTDTCRSE